MSDTNVYLLKDRENLATQSDQSLCCLDEETLHPWISIMRLVKIMIRLREC